MVLIVTDSDLLKTSIEKNKADLSILDFRVSLSVIEVADRVEYREHYNPSDSTAVILKDRKEHIHEHE